MDIETGVSFWEVGWSNYVLSRDDFDRINQKRFFRDEASAETFQVELVEAMTVLGITTPQAKMYCCKHTFQPSTKGYKNPDGN